MKARYLFLGGLALGAAAGLLNRQERVEPDDGKDREHYDLMDTVRLPRVTSAQYQKLNRAKLAMISLGHRVSGLWKRDPSP